METMLKFKRLSALSSDSKVVLKALESAKSSLMEVDVAGDRLRRLPTKPVPEWNEDRKKEVMAMTVYAKGFDKENTELDELLEHFRGQNVLNIQMRMFNCNKTKTKGFKVS